MSRIHQETRQIFSCEKKLGANFPAIDKKFRYFAAGKILTVFSAASEIFSIFVDEVVQRSRLYSHGVLFAYSLGVRISGVRTRPKKYCIPQRSTPGNSSYCYRCVGTRICQSVPVPVQQISTKNEILKYLREKSVFHEGNLN